MVLLNLFPGDIAIHEPTKTRVEIVGFADGNFIAIPVDETDEVTHAKEITAPATEFVKASPAQLVAKPAPVDPELAATAKRISELQAQVADLQKKLQKVEAERDAAAERAVALIAEASAPPPQPQTRIETRIQTNIGEQGLARYLNEGWGILHMQFIHMTHYDGEQVVALNVVLQREVPVPPPEQPEQRAAAPQPVRTVTGTVVQSEPAPAPAAEPNGVFAQIIRQHHLPIAERIQMMNQRIVDDVLARSAARNPQPFQHRPLITTGVQS